MDASLSFVNDERPFQGALHAALHRAHAFQRPGAAPPPESLSLIIRTAHKFKCTVTEIQHFLAAKLGLSHVQLALDPSPPESFYGELVHVGREEPGPFGSVVRTGSVVPWT